MESPFLEITGVDFTKTLKGLTGSTNFNVKVGKNTLTVTSIPLSGMTRPSLDRPGQKTNTPKKITIDIGADAIIKQAFSKFKRNLRGQLTFRRVTEPSEYPGNASTETPKKFPTGYSEYLDSVVMKVIDGQYVISIGNGEDAYYAKLIDQAFPGVNRKFLPKGRYYLPYKKNDIRGRERSEESRGGWIYVAVPRFVTVKNKPVNTDIAWTKAINEIARALRAQGKLG